MEDRKMNLGKKLVTIGIVACLSVTSSMMVFAGQTPVITFFGKQPVEQSDSDFIQLTNEDTEKVHQFSLYNLPDGTSVESLGEDAKYVINASGSPTSTAATGKWVEDGIGWWYDNGDGTYPVNTWKVINNVYYYFGADGYMLHDTTTPDGYNVDSNGAWIEENAISLETWKGKFRTNWAEAYNSVSDPIDVLKNPSDLGPVKFTFTMDMTGEVTEEIVKGLCEECARTYTYPRQYYWYYYSSKSGILTITAVSSGAPIPESMKN